MSATKQNMFTKIRMKLSTKLSLSKFYSNIIGIVIKAVVKLNKKSVRFIILKTDEVTNLNYYNLRSLQFEIISFKILKVKSTLAT